MTEHLSENLDLALDYASRRYDEEAKRREALFNKANGRITVLLTIMVLFSAIYAQIISKEKFTLNVLIFLNQLWLALGALGMLLLAFSATRLFFITGISKSISIVGKDALVANAGNLASNDFKYLLFESYSRAYNFHAEQNNVNAKNIKYNDIFILSGSLISIAVTIAAELSIIIP